MKIWNEQILQSRYVWQPYVLQFHLLSFRTLFLEIYVSVARDDTRVITGDIKKL
jgi:hypothetical protein